MTLVAGTLSWQPPLDKHLLANLLSVTHAIIMQHHLSSGSMYSLRRCRERISQTAENSKMTS